MKLQNLETHEMGQYAKRIEELKSKLEEAVEANERLTEDARLKTNNYETLIKENENLLLKIDQLERSKSKVENEFDRLLDEKSRIQRLHDEVNVQMKNLSELLEVKEKDILRLKDEYEIFKEEYRKLSQHKDELEHEFKETLIQENKKLTAKYDDLSQLNAKINEELIEKQRTIDSLQTEIEKLEHRDSSSEKELNLNETRVVSFGRKNEIYMNLRQENLKLLEEKEKYVIFPALL